MTNITTERKLLAIAMALGASKVPGWSREESRLVQNLPSPSVSDVESANQAIKEGRDPLGELFCSIRSPSQRRSHGATYTPTTIVNAMMVWAKKNGDPTRVVDPGAGSGRFTVSAGRTFPAASLVAIELDPVAAILCRGHVGAAGQANRTQVVLQDYREIELARLPKGQQTLFIGNPPFVRHHLINLKWKSWLRAECVRRGIRGSALAGLHVHFFLATANHAQPGDIACIITSAEWLDVNYGQTMRELVLDGLGGRQIVVVEPAAQPFPDAQTTAAISCFEIGNRSKSILMRRVNCSSALRNLEGGLRVHRKRLETEQRWSRLTRRSRKAPGNFVELGELCRVHRGTVTGANSVWIAGEHATGLPKEVLFSTVTKARELYAAGRRLENDQHLRKVVDLPPDLDVFDSEARTAIERFLRIAKDCNAHESYIARHRKPWWTVRLCPPAPILATYMARRSPAFVRNTAQARHLNIAHGIYPRESMTPRCMEKLINYLNDNTSTVDGRTYSGGLTKFEPREMERLLIPEPLALEAGVSA